MGTGKSRIVDAIEFALSGNISRLASAGTGGPFCQATRSARRQSQQAGGRVGNRRRHSARARQQEGPDRRSVKSASAPEITPADKDVIATFESINLHPEFVLSRRELIRYVLSEPGQRAKEVQSLLRLDEIEKLRGVLQKIANACTKELSGLERAERDAITDLLAALDTAQLTRKSVLDAVNPQRELLGLAPLPELDANTSLKDGLTATAPSGSARVPKTQATADLATLRQALQALEADAFSRPARPPIPLRPNSARMPTASPACRTKRF